MKFLQSKLFAAILGAMMFLLTTAFLTTSGLKPVDSLEDEAGADHHAVTKGPSWTFFNPELDQIVAELKAEREALSAREKQMGELAARLKAERAELDAALGNVKKLQQ